MKDCIIGSIFRHFEGGFYQILHIAKDTETEKTVVVYRSLKNGQIWCRPMDMFFSTVDRKKYPYAIQEKRFELHKCCANCFWNNKFDDGTVACGLSCDFVEPLESCEEFESENDVKKVER